MTSRIMGSVTLLTALLLAGCAQPKDFSFQNVPGHVSIPGNWIDKSEKGKSVAASPDGKATVVSAAIPKVPDKNLQSVAEDLLKSRLGGEGVFQGLTINGRPAVMASYSSQGKVGALSLSEGKLEAHYVLIVAAGEGISEQTAKSIVSSYKE